MNEFAGGKEGWRWDFSDIAEPTNERIIVITKAESFVNRYGRKAKEKILEGRKALQ